MAIAIEHTVMAIIVVTVPEIEIMVAAINSNNDNRNNKMKSSDRRKWIMIISVGALM